MIRSQSGFTLLEVVVAAAVIGAGFAAGLAAMAGSLRLLRTAGEYEQAMLLARATMTEAIAYPDYEIIDDREREIYRGTEYSYRLEFRPVRLTPEGAAPPSSPISLQQIAVDVYWGEGSSARSYRLVTYRLMQTAPDGAAARGRAKTASADGGRESESGAGKSGGSAGASGGRP